MPRELKTHFDWLFSSSSVIIIIFFCYLFCITLQAENLQSLADGGKKRDQFVSFYCSCSLDQNNATAFCIDIIYLKEKNYDY